jgi:hypothetical protein
MANINAYSSAGAVFILMVLLLLFAWIIQNLPHESNLLATPNSKFSAEHICSPGGISIFFHVPALNRYIVERICVGALKKPLKPFWFSSSPSGQC